MISNLQDAITYLEGSKRGERRNDFLQLKRGLSLLQNPQNAFEILHIAGTNGKGSTASFAASILHQYGDKVGLFVSPYVISFQERIQVNGVNISNSALLRLTNQIVLLQERLKEEGFPGLVFFEMVFLIALLYFKEQQVGYAVLECGMGGRMDVTNSIIAKISIITNIGWDHMKYLGNTREEIALEKLGIVKENGILITAVDQELLPLFKDYCKRKKAKLSFIDKDKIYWLDNGFFSYEKETYFLPLEGDYQAQNALLAIMGCKALNPLISLDDIQCGLGRTVCPARLEVLRQNPTFLLDGAHNVTAVSAVASFLKKKKISNLTVLFTALGDKDYEGMIQILDEITSRYVFTTIPDQRAVLLGNLSSKKDFLRIPDYKEAIETVLKIADPQGTILCIGSLHFASLVRKYILNK